MRRQRRRRVAVAVLAIATAVATPALVGCADEGEGKAPAAGEAPDPALVDPPWFPIRHVFVTYGPKREASGKPGKGPDLRTKAEAFTRAKDLRARLVAPGAAFPEIAKSDSDEPTSAPDGGFMGFYSRWTLRTPKSEGKGIPEVLLAAVEGLPDGGISEPIEEGGGYHVLQRLSKEEGRRVESEVVAVIDGYFVPWSPQNPGMPASRTKDAAYADVAAAVNDIRLQKAPPDETFQRIPGATGVHDAVRRAGAKPGYEAMIDAALALPVGEFTNPVDTPQGWAVLVRAPYLRARIRHIVVTHRSSKLPSPPERTEADAEARAIKALEEVRKDRSRWDAVAKEYSDEPISRQRGGSLGEVTNAVSGLRKLIPGEFEAAIDALKPGEISDVVETRVGFHVIWRVD